MPSALTALESDHEPPGRRGRILCVTSNFPRWSGDSVTPFVLRLAQDLTELGWDLDVLAPHDAGAKMRECLDGVSTERFRYMWPETAQTVCYRGGALVNLRQNRINYLKVPSLVGAEFLAVLRRLMVRRYDLIHAHWILPQGLTCALAAQLARKPLVVTAHGGDVFALQGSLLRTFKSATLRMADAVTTNSSLTRNAVLDIDSRVSQLEQIPASPAEGPVDEQLKLDLRARYRDPRGPLLIFLGRLVEEKGLGDLLTALQAVRQEIPGVRLLVVGDGQDKQQFVQRTQELQLADCVTFTGWVDQSQVPTYLAAADIFVGPSRKAVDGWVEAQGLTFVEAMLAGTPVIATRTGGIVESIHDGETGLLVDERRPDQIAEAIRTLVISPALADLFKDQALRFARQHLSRKSAADRYSKLFEQLLHGDRSPQLTTPSLSVPSFVAGRYADPDENESERRTGRRCNAGELPSRELAEQESER